MLSSSKLSKAVVTLLCVCAWQTACSHDLQTPQEAHDQSSSPAASRPRPGSLTAAKIATPLQNVLQRMQQDGITATNVTERHPETYSTPLVRVDAAGRVHTTIQVTTFDAQVEAVLAGHQIAIDAMDTASHLLQAWIPFYRLDAIAALPFVRSLRPPSYALRR